LTQQIGPHQFQEIVIAVQQLYMGVILSGTELYSLILENALVFSTGCKGIDDLLGGGIFTGELTELVGAVASGKSQVTLF